MQIITQIKSVTELVDTKEYGNKAYWLSWLHNEGYNVPFAYYFPALDNEKAISLLADLGQNKDFKEVLKRFKKDSEEYSVAIRSSGTEEDDIAESKAGHFKSFVGKVTYSELLANIQKVIDSNTFMDNTFNKMGVIIQKKVNATFSGVIFSSNILYLNKEECIISITKGMGEELVSGKKSGEDLIVRFEDNKPNLPLIKSNISHDVLITLIKISKEIELKLEFPVDIEWSVDQNGELHVLQCRSVTGIGTKTQGIFQITLENEKLIPSQVINHDKVNLRLFAQRKNVKISKAYLVVLPCPKRPVTIDLDKIEPEKYCRGFSVVSIFPKRIKGKVVRYFAEKEMKKQQFLYRTCQRYQVRTYEDKTSLESTITRIANYCFQYSWLSITIIQEIFKPEYTGILRKTQHGYIIELGKGHFIPKGMVPTTQYLVSETGQVNFKNEIIQPVFYDIVDGNVIEEKYHKKVAVSNDTLNALIHSLKPILNNENQSLEFGILFENTNPLPYLIDLVEDKSTSDLSPQLLNEGVISQGKVTGSIVNISDLESGLHLHFHDKKDNKSKEKGKYIFVCETPDIALLDLVNSYNSQNVGFIFRSGSILSHFPIILRERKIPAIVSNEISVDDSKFVKIDTMSEKIGKQRRIERIDGYVFPYVNPDTDGVCTAIALNRLNTSYIPVFFGELDTETQYVLRTFNVDFPKKVTKIENDALIAIVDTHHIAQLPDNINYENVVEIVDHHPTGDAHKFPNAIIQNEKVGAACTLIVERMKKNGFIPSREIAGIMGYAIISNTLNFTAPSTSARDKEALNWLKSYCEFTENVTIGMFKARSNFLTIPTEELVRKNTKLFEFDRNKIGICQLEMVGVNKLLEREDFSQELIKYKEGKKCDYFIFSGVDIYERQTAIKVIDDASKKLINKSMNFEFINDISVVNQILLRKTDFIPKIKEYLKN